MSGREVREYTNLTDPKDRKYGKGKDKIDDEEITFQRMVSKMQDVAGERGGYLHGRGALDSDDLLYLKEQMEAEQDAERLLRRTENRAFLAFKAVADSSPTPVPLSLRVEPKAKSGIRQQDLLKRVVEVRPKKQKVSDATDGKHEAREPSPASENESVQGKVLIPETKHEKPSSPSRPRSLKNEVHVENPVKSLLEAYDSSDDDD